MGNHWKSDGILGTSSTFYAVLKLVRSSLEKTFHEFDDFWIQISRNLGVN